MELLTLHSILLIP